MTKHTDEQMFELIEENRRLALRIKELELQLYERQDAVRRMDARTKELEMQQKNLVDALHHESKTHEWVLKKGAKQ